MKYLFVSSKGDACPFAHRLADNEHDIKLYIKNDEHDLWSGLITKVPSFGEALEPDRIVVFDRPGGGRTADRLRRQGHTVVGAGRFHDRLAFMPAQAVEALRADGIRVHPEFGKIQNISLGIEGWFNGARWLFPSLVVLQWHRLMPADLGPWIGSTGTILIPLLNESAPLLTDTLYKLTSTLQHRKYCGPLGLTVDTSTLEVRSIRTHFDSNILSGLRHLLECDLIERLASPETTSIAMAYSLATVVRVTIPRPVPNLPIGGVDNDDLGMLDFFDVKLDPAGNLVTAGGSNHILNASVGRVEPREAAKVIFGDTLARLALQDKQYRIDLGLALPDLDWRRVIGAGRWPAGDSKSMPSNTERTEDSPAVTTEETLQ
jgi:hypothetical protein